MEANQGLLHQEDLEEPADAGDGGQDHGACLDYWRTPPLSGAAPTIVLPRRRGRRSKGLQALTDRWCPDHRLA